MVLEFMDGGDLQGLIANRKEAEGGSFPAHFARRVLAAVGGALAYIHHAGILHRDVKPANVLLARRSQRIKLGDFGVAKLVECATLKAQTLVGTPYYFSPELVSGDEYGPASDCWALGACLYEVVMLQRPFEASNQLALIRKICDESPAELADDTAEDVRQAVNGLLKKDPRFRLPLDAALAVSVAVSALVVDGEERPEDSDTLSCEEDIREEVEEEQTASRAEPVTGSMLAPDPQAEEQTCVPTLLPSDEDDDSWAV